MSLRNLELQRARELCRRALNLRIAAESRTQRAWRVLAIAVVLVALSIAGTMWQWREMQHRERLLEEWRRGCPVAPATARAI